MPQQQKAVFVREIRKPVELGTRDMPAPKERHVLLKVTATMLLPHDAYGRDIGLFMEDKLPCIPGANVAGLVEQAEPSTGLKKGDHVFDISYFESSIPNQQGPQEYAVLQADALAKVPEGFGDDQAVSLPYGLGWTAPWNLAGGEASIDQSLVIIGGGSSTGKLAVQLAKITGVRQITVIAGLKNKDELEKMGAAHVDGRHGSIEEVTNRVHAISSSDVTHILDIVNQSFELATSLLSRTQESKLVTFLPDYHPEILAEQRPKCKAIFVEGGNERLGEHKRDFWKHAAEWLAAGKILPTAFWTLDGLENVEKIHAALDTYSAGAGGSQLIVHP